MRLIDADKLMIDMMDRGVDHIQTDDLMELNQIIDEQPTVEQQKWIPCSERLPEDEWKGYLVTFVFDDLDGERVIVDKLPFYDGKFHIANYYGKFEVLAWMPLPEPYKEGEE